MQDLSIIQWPSCRRSLLARLLRLSIGPAWDASIEAGQKMDEAELNAGQALAKTDRTPQPGRRYLVEHDDYHRSVILRYEELVSRGETDSPALFHMFASADFARYLKFRRNWIESPVMQGQIVVHHADVRADPFRWTEWALDQLVPGQRLTPLIRARVERAFNDWVADNPEPDPNGFRFFNPKVFSWLANLHLTRETVQWGFRQMLGRDVAEQDMIAFQTLPDVTALEDHLMGTAEYRQRRDQPPAVAASDVAAAYRVFLGREARADAPPAFSSPEQMFDALVHAPEFALTGNGRKTALGWPLSQVFVSPKARVLYCPIGKNACTFLKSQMARISALKDSDFILKNIHVVTDLATTGLQLSDYAPETAAAMIADPAFVRIAMLRDPFERLLSAYIEKFVLGRGHPANIAHTSSITDLVYKERGQDPDYGRGITFAEFVGMLVRQPAEALDTHWRPQHLYLAGISYDRIFRFDEMNQLVDLLEARSGLKLPRQARNATGSGEGLPVSGASAMLPAALAAQPRIHRSSFLTPELAHAIRTFFKDDYAILDKLTHSTH